MLKADVSTCSPIILFVQKLMEVLVEFSNKFRCHSACRVVSNKRFQLVLLTGHQIYKFQTVDILKRADSVSREASEFGKEFVTNFVHVETAIINQYL